MPEPTDFNDPFSHFDPEVSMPLSAADVRRRGDRLRRRNTGLAIAGGVAVIALIAAPIAVLSGGDDTDALPPAAPPTSAVDSNPPTPTEPAPADLVTTIPDDFPLAAGLPEVNSETGVPTEVVRGGETTDFPLCQEAGFDPATSSAITDLASVAYLAPEDGRQRLLAVWDDVEGATTALAGVRDTLAGCDAQGARYTEESSPYDEPSAVFVVQYSAFGDFSQGDELAIGLSVIEAVQVRNTIYLTRYDNEGGVGREAVLAGIERSKEESTPAVSAVRTVFVSGEDNTSAGSAELLSPVDLPDRGRLGAWAEDPDDTTTWACGRAGLFTDLEADTSVAVRYAASGSDDQGGPAIARVRTAVLQLSPGDAAERAYDQLQDNLAFCADEDDGIEPLKAGGYLQGLGDDATWSGFAYAATEICTDCDAFWFDRMGVARVGDRIVVVSYAEVGGPLQPEDLNQTFLEVFQRAVALA